MQGGRLMTDEANMRSAAGLSVQGWRPSAQHSPICQQREALRFRQSRRQQSLTVCKAAPGQRKCRKLMESESSGSISWPQRLASFGAACVLTLGIVEVAGAEAADKIGEFTGSGFIFKDSVETVSVEDPEVQGVTIYITDFKRSFADKLSKDFFNEPSQASVTCASTGPVFVKDRSRIAGREGKEVFSEKKAFSLSFANKTLRVRRLLDEKHDTLLYVAYSTRNTSPQDEQGKVSSGRYKTSVCALPISPEASQAAAVAAEQQKSR